MEYSFHCMNSMAPTGITTVLSRFLEEVEAPPVILCIGSDLAIGDCLGPVTGTLLKRRLGGHGIVYGTLKAPVTAKEVKYVGEFLKKTHPTSKLIAIDAALGEESEIGLIKLSQSALRPGSGANKRLGKIGDVSIIGVVAQKSNFPYSALNLTRLSPVYSMAETIARGIEGFLLNQLTKWDGGQAL